MITDEYMKEAALELDGMMLDRLPDRGELGFSPAFERKMKKLIYRKKHPVMSHPVFRIAAILLVALLLGGTMLLSVPEVQAGFKGLFVEEQDHCYCYVLTGYVATDDLRTYHLGWVSEGYEIYHERHWESQGTVGYRNQDREFISLSYLIQREGSKSEYNISYEEVEYRHRETTVNGHKADLFEFRGAGDYVGYTVIWMNEEQSILFRISGAKTEAEAVKLAQSVISREPEE